jgi:hypothetical protein
VAELVEPLRRALARERDHAGIALLQKEAAARGWAFLGGSEDLAFCKPAVSSSVSRWSWFPDPERDACGANGDPPADDYGFHTSEEASPWWMVDLLDEYLVGEVAIVNRYNNRARFRTFRIESSCDGSVWTARHSQVEPCDVSTDPEQPWRVSFAEPFVARYIRIVLLGTGVLHLYRVLVFGHAQYAR